MKGKPTSEQAWAAIRGERGLMASIAQSCGISRQAVLQWKRVPEQHLDTVAKKVLGVGPWELRPDLYRNRKDA